MADVADIPPMTALPSYAAIGLLFVGAAATSGSGDYALVVPNQPAICAKSVEVCKAAREAIKRGWFLPEVGRDAATYCIASPGCFTAESLVIRGFNDR